MNPHKIFSKKTLLIPVILMILVVAGIGAFLFLDKRQNDKLTKQIDNDIGALIEKGCVNGDTSGLESAYQKTNSDEERAKIAGIVARCASKDIKDIEKSLDWSKKASEDYKKIGNEQESKGFQTYVEQFESLKQINTDTIIPSGEEKGIN